LENVEILSDKPFPKTKEEISSDTSSFANGKPTLPNSRYAPFFLFSINENNIYLLLNDSFRLTHLESPAPQVKLHSL
jgi:hypothetical protein